MSTQAPQLPSAPNIGQMPPFIAASPQQLENQAVATQQQEYALSDADFRARYPQLFNAQTTFLNNLNQQVSGNITPQLQNLWTRGGLTNALGATGNWSLGTGTPGMANIARNLGIDMSPGGAYQQGLLQQFNTANSTFLPRPFGLGAAAGAQVNLANIAGQNNWNSAQYAYNVQNAQFGTNLAAQQAVANANAANASTGNILGAGGGAISALAVVAFAA